MFNIILHEPEIPPNTGNVMRLCANTGARLHLIRPLGFSLDARRLRRAGLDYREFADVGVHADLAGCIATLGAARLFAIESGPGRSYVEAAFRPGWPWPDPPWARCATRCRETASRAAHPA